MIERTVTIEVDLTPEELAVAFWDLGQNQQAEFFNELCFRGPLSEVVRQNRWRRIQLSEWMTANGRKMMEEIGEYSAEGMR